MRAVEILFFFFNDTATTEIYTLSLHDALPIYLIGPRGAGLGARSFFGLPLVSAGFRIGVVLACSLVGILGIRDRKSTRLNSSHANISYAVFCLKKKNT